MRKHLYNPKTLVTDIIAGLTLGIESIPDAMASALLAAVNPIHGVYAVMLASVCDRIKEQLDETETTEELFGEEDISAETDILGESVQAACQAAQDWLEILPIEKEVQDTWRSRRT